MSKETPSANDELAALVAERQHALRHGAEEDATDVEPTVPLLLMRLGERWFGLRAESVREVVGRERITRVPGQPAHIQGVALIHGRLVPVMTVDVLLGVAVGAGAGRGAADDAGRRLVVLAQDDAEIAIIADDARGVVYLPFAIDKHAGAERAPFIAGEVSWQDRLVCVLDGPALMTAATLSGRK